MVMSDSGSRMGATTSVQVRLDTVIVAAGRFLASPDIGFRSPFTGRPVCVVVIDSRFEPLRGRRGDAADRCHFCRGQALQFWAAEPRRAFAKRQPTRQKMLFCAPRADRAEGIVPVQNGGSRTSVTGVPVRGCN